MHGFGAAGHNARPGYQKREKAGVGREGTELHRPSDLRGT
jgi:hypothetical protein